MDHSNLQCCGISGKNPRKPSSDSRCRTEGFCDSRVSVVKVCNKDSAVSQRNVNIDTVSAPRFAITTCKCVISSSGIYGKFTFIYTGSTAHTGFKLNERYLKKQDKEDIYDRADLFFTTNDFTTANGCLNVYTENGTNLNITYFPNSMTRTTTDPIRPRTSSSSTGITSVTEVVVEVDRNSEYETDIRRNETNFNITYSPNITTLTTDPAKPSASYSDTGITKVTEAEVKAGRNSKHETDILAPVVTTVSVVCIAGVIALVVVCRRRSLADKQKSKTSTAVVEKEKEDEYYMTENPMYDATDVEPNVPSAESEYHYIDVENQDGSMPDCLYESIPDFL